MNVGCFRQVADAVRDMVVSVGKHSAGQPKGVAAAPHRGRKARVGRSRQSDSRSDSRSATRFATRPITFAAWCAFGMQPCPADAKAPLPPLTPDHSAIGAFEPRPRVSVAANDVPVVQIVGPNAAGVSHNRFAQYNVGRSGVVLNNSGTPTHTHTAGWVGGNPFLGNGHARVILNEVTSGNPSRLLGMTEVAGRAANVVVANPAGIYCNGCGFINAPRATLTTGVPVLNGLGALTSLDVMQGALTVEGQGLDARGSSQLDLIARAMRINGQIWARRITAVAGANHVGYVLGDVSAKGGDTGPPPIVAIDVAALGGMYANAVRLVSTERGVGVNLNGMVNSLTSDIDVSSAGDVTIARGGALLAAQNAVLNAASVRNAGTITANKGVARLDANDVVNTNGTITGQSVSIDAATALRNDSGEIVAKRALTANAGEISNQNGLLKSLAGTVTLAAKGEFDNREGLLVAAADIEVRARDVRNVDGKFEAPSGAVRAFAERTLTNEGGQILGESVTARAGESLLNIDGRIDASGATRLDTATLVNMDGKISGAKVDLAVTDALKNDDGRIIAKEALDVKAGAVSNHEGKLTSSGTATLVATREFDNRDGLLAGADGINVQAATLINEDGKIGFTDSALEVGADGELSSDDR
ncbi:MAG TPA: filamentous hemagglutinin N-terminal domain-containing protein [Trinickia sp.]|nr:filamentous hemagglutinin N-terminal domain-containing protein [Trinickia sp.]